MSFPVASRHVGRRLWTADAPGATCTAIVLGAGRAGPAHERRARRAAPARPAGLPAGARERLADRLRRRRRSRCASTPARRGWPTRRSPGSSSARTAQVVAAVRRGRHVPADRGAQRRAAHVRGVRASTRRRIPRRACGPSRGRTTRRLRRRPCRRARSSPRARAAWSRSRSRASTRRRPARRPISSPAGETVRIPIRRNDTSIDLPPYRVGLEHVDSPITVTPFSRFDAAAGPRRQRVRGSARRSRATASARRARRRSSLSSASNGDGTSTVTAPRLGRIRRRRVRHCGTASSARASACTPTADGGDRDLPRAPRRRRVLVHAVRRVLVRRRRRSGRRPTHADACAPSRPAGPRRGTPSSSMPRRTSATDGRSGSSAHEPDVDRARSQPQPRRVRRLGADASIFDRDPGDPGALRARDLGDGDLVGDRHPRAGQRALPGAGAAGSVQTCVGGSDLVAVGDSSNDPRRQGGDHVRQRPVCATTTRRRDPAAHRRHVDGAGRRRARGRRQRRRSTGARRAGASRPRTRRSRRPATRTCPIRRNPGRTDPEPARITRHPQRRDTSMTITQEQATWFAQTFGQIADNVERAVLGKRHVVELVLTAMLSDGHVLLEDVPGTGKTSLARAIGAVGAGHEHAHPVHPRPAARRHHRHHGVRPEDGRLRVPRRPDLRQHRARRRDQPGEPEDAVRAARGDGGGQASRSTASRGRSACRSSCSPRRTRSSRPAPTGCPRRSSTAS